MSRITTDPSERAGVYKRIEDVPDPEPHDVPLDIVVTPNELIRNDTPFDRPVGVD